MLLETKIPFTYLFNKVKKDILRVFIISIIFHTVKHFYAPYLPKIPITLPTVLGTTISLLLAFRLNQAYDRWWEARKIWGSIVNDSRSFILQLKGFVKDTSFRDENIKALYKNIAYRQIGWGYCLGQSLRKDHNAIDDIECFVAGEDMLEMRRHNNKPLFLIMKHYKDLKELHNQDAINDFQEVQLNATMVRLVDSMGAAERIKNTVFPSTYSQFIHFFIYLFLTLLSISLVESMGLFEIPTLMLFASTFFLVEKSSRHMQNPFQNKPTDTAMTSIARTIEINIREILKEDPDTIPEPIKANGFYIM